ncbi:MAG: peptidylprolyl isomerase [Eubacteriales bacterium]|nr:peptidylprolyl isomerase [Eubacteriales bacterium]MDD3074295.1 peptidylprolyl isomerase [Eubacteriales bacterium]MDD4079215.1 peptidylprolyl isomerase [Eubacteriales bacterium]MDD4769523.1 peptidylprolyl isomerase [Eubacteriales bacterium]
MEDGGIIEIELYPDIAPNTVRNFIALAKQGFYDGLTFHRVIPGFMIQGGCPLGTGGGDPGYFISGEFSDNGFENSLKHKTGVISMARLANNCDSAGSQFFITVGPSLWLDGQHAAFGKVIAGLEIAQEIAEVDKDEDDAPLQPQRIKKITVNTFGRKYDPPEKIRK